MILKSKITFNKNYAILAILLLILEIAIALFVRDSLIRPYVGDVLVVIFLYCLLKTFLKISTNVALSFALTFAFIVEGLQLLNITTIFDISNPVFRIILGSHFEIQDLLAYCLGAVLIITTEHFLTN